MASEASFCITIAWLYPAPCVCGHRRWYVTVNGRGVGWAHHDATEACVQEGA